MTPEKARELLDIANRGAGDGQRPVTVAASHAPLAEAAYALAQTVANMHYEYAVQAGVDDKGDYVHTYGRYQTRDEAAEVVALFKHMNPEVAARIVRRLATDPEVVDPPSPNRIHFCTEDDLFGDIEEVAE